MGWLTRASTVIVLGALLFFVLTYITTSRKWWKGNTGRFLVGIAFSGAMVILLAYWVYLPLVAIVQAVFKVVLSTLIIISAVAIERSQVEGYRKSQERLSNVH